MEVVPLALVCPEIDGARPLRMRYEGGKLVFGVDVK